MNRQFFIYTAADGKCTVREGDSEMTYEFSDILEAISCVRRQRGGEPVDVTSFDPTGQVVFRQTIK